MNNQTNQPYSAPITRRQLLGAATATAALAALPGGLLRQAQSQTSDKPNSCFHGVQIGTITYSFRSMPSSAEDILSYAKQCGLSSVELMGGPAEQFAGIPSGKGKKVLDWRLSASMDRFKALRKLYNDAGVAIHIVKFGNIGNKGMSEAEMDYYFNVAKALGAKGITREMSEDAAKRLGPVADKHRIMIGFHNHTQIKPDSYDGSMLSHGRYLGINLDVGHYVAGTNESPIPLIEKHHNRILSLHIKDRQVNNGGNVPLGQGDTPLGLILHLMKRNQWTFPVDIELEYKIPQGSNAVDEVAKCVQFCKKKLG